MNTFAKIIIEMKQKQSDKEIKDFIENEEGISLGEYISNGIKNRDIEPELVLEWFIKNCNDEIIQKFINWVLE